MFEFLFLDLDDTILDFQKAEHTALSKTLQSFGLAPTEEVLKRYNKINKAHWEALERKELTRDQVLLGRFQMLFREFQLDVDAEQAAGIYARNLSVGHWFLPGADEAVKSLSKKYKLYLASNGTASVQKGRMDSADLYRFFEKVFISQEIGVNKPSAEFFERCFAQIPNFDKTKAIIVGDSLTSDILGGQNAGIATCWVNPHHKERREDIRVDYEIEALSQLESLLETL